MYGSRIAVGETSLATRVVMAMPMGPPYGGMTSNSAIMRGSAIFDHDRAALLDTTPRGNGAGRVLHSARLFRKLRALVNEQRAEVVFFSSSSFLGFYEKAAMALMCKQMGVATVIHIVGSFIDFRDGVGPVERRIIDYFVRGFDRVLVVSERFQTYLEAEVPGANVHIVPNPIQCSEFPFVERSRPTTATRFLFAGAIVEGKGVFDLIEAVSLVRDQLPDASFKLIGGGGELEECRRRITARGLGDLMSMPGFVDESEKRTLFRTCDVLVLPSHFEALPVSVLEASSSGMAVVATDVGGVTSAVIDGVTGLVVPPRDPRRLGDALVALAADAELRRSMGAAGAAHVRARFDAPIVAASLIASFNELAAKEREDL